VDSRQNLHNWEILFSLIRTGSITETALEMDCAASAVSKAVRALEEDMGCDFFDRTSRPFRPTGEALDLVYRVQPLLSSLKNAIDETERSRESVLLRVAAPPDLIIDFLGDQIMTYCEAHKNISLDLSLTPSLEGIVSGKLDAALMQQPVSKAGLVIRPCITCSCCPLASPEYLKKHGTPKTLADLKDHTGLLLRWNGEPPSRFLYGQDGVPSPAIAWKRFFITDNQVTLRNWALAGCGITIDLAASHVIEELESGQLVPVLSEWHRKDWRLCVVTRSDREEASPELRNFAAWWASRESLDSMTRIVQGTDIIRQSLASSQERGRIDLYGTKSVLAHPKKKRAPRPTDDPRGKAL
jgi:DNA-binding transcriptional LysR family regulator